jgi:hypothetical protein
MDQSGWGRRWGFGPRYNRRRAAEKQKEEKGMVSSYDYKQATPTGFEDTRAKQR